MIVRRSQYSIQSLRLVLPMQQAATHAINQNFLDHLVIADGVPAPTPAFVYNALGKKPLPSKERIVADTVDSIAARFNLRYSEQKWLSATAELVADDRDALDKFLH